MVITDVKRIKSASSGALSKSNSGVKSPLSHNYVVFLFFFFASSQTLAATYPPLRLVTTYLSLRCYLQKWCDFSLGALCRAHSVAVAKKDLVAERSQDGTAATPTCQSSTSPGS